MLANRPDIRSYALALGRTPNAEGVTGTIRANGLSRQLATSAHAKRGHLRGVVID